MEPYWKNIAVQNIKHGCVSLKVLGKDHPELALSEWEAEGVHWEDFDHESSVCPEYEPVELRHTGDDAAELTKRFGSGWFNHRRISCA